MFGVKREDLERQEDRFLALLGELREDVRAIKHKLANIAGENQALGRIIERAPSEQDLHEVQLQVERLTGLIALATERAQAADRRSERVEDMTMEGRK